MASTTFDIIFEVPILLFTSIFNILDSNYISGYSLLDIILAILFLVVFMTVVFWYFDIDLDLWSVFDDDDEDD